MLYLYIVAIIALPVSKEPWTGTYVARVLCGRGRGRVVAPKPWSPCMVVNHDNMDPYSDMSTSATMQLARMTHEIT